MKYKYQLHTHTTPCSKCAPMTPEELVESLYTGGFKGCVLTNHFFGGNSGIDRDLPWHEFVLQYEKDYQECKKAALKYDLDIIFGIEENVGNGLEILCYGITPQFLCDNPNLRENHTVEAWSKALHGVGALCIQAHPFRKRDYIKNPGLLPVEYIDGIEVFNACNKSEENDTALIEAQKYPEWILVSGADTHLTQSVCWAGIETNERINDEKKLVNILKSGEYQLLK